MSAHRLYSFIYTFKAYWTPQAAWIWLENKQRYKDGCVFAVRFMQKFIQFQTNTEHDTKNANTNERNAVSFILHQWHFQKPDFVNIGKYVTRQLMKREKT